jgi:hypothetical protein
MANPGTRKDDEENAIESMETLEVNDPRTPKERIEPDQIKDWAQRLNVSTTRLREAVQRAGPVLDDVKRFLAHH